MNKAKHNIFSFLKSRKNIFAFATIVIIAAILRLINLGDMPTGFFRDEAALGYNSYSLLRSGADEYGMKFPIVFRSFEVFFLPLYEYLTAVIMYFLGMNEFSTRLLSSVSGIITVIVIYKLSEKYLGRTAGLISALILALSPWHIYYSRGAFEGNLALALFSIGFYFWSVFKVSRKVNILTYSLIFFILSMYSYQAERMVVPLFMIWAAIDERKWIFKNIQRLIFPAILGILLLVPLLSLTFSAGGYHRAKEVSVFSKSGEPYGFYEGKPENFITNNSTWLRFKEFSSLYFSYFSPRNIFSEGDSDRQRSVENTSVLYPWLFPFTVYGIYLAAKNAKLRGLVVWMLVAPLPASFTGDPFHTYRSLLLYFPLTLMSAYGVTEFISRGSAGYLKALGVLGLSFVSLVFFIFNYAFLSQSTRSRAWDYGYKELFDFLGERPGDTKIVIDDLYTEVYIHYLFFNKIDPLVYHSEVSKLGPSDSYYYSDSRRIRPNIIKNFEFRRVDWAAERGNTGVIYVFYAPQLPDSEFINDPKVELLKKIVYPDGSDAYKIVKIR